MVKSPRVVDFSTHLSGPVASRRLAQMGADVIKVERPGIGDGNRLFPPLFHGEGVHHLYLNAGTRSLALDSRTPFWADVVASAARWADVVIVGNHPTHAAQMGIDAASLLRHNTELIYCAITGYGVDGEWASLPAHGLNMDALAASIELDWSDGQPQIPERYRSVGTTVAGIEAVAGIYAALHHRSLGGGGQVVHVSIWEAALAAQWRDTVTQANLVRPWTAYRDLGSRYAVYGSSDGMALLLCPIERRFWESFCDALDLPGDVRARGDWSSGVDMGAAYVALGERELIAGHILSRPRQEWLSLLRDAKVPAAPVLQDVREVMASPHARANGTMTTYRYHDYDVTIPVCPLSITPASRVMGNTGPGTAGDAALREIAAGHRAKGAKLGRAPYLGEHSEEIMREFGLAG